MVSKALEKKRIKGRKNRVTIDDKYMGPEPWWDDKVPSTASSWSQAAHWYN